MNGRKESIEMKWLRRIVIAAVAVFFLAGAMYWSYLYSQTRPAGLMFPGGVTYRGPSR